MSDIDDLDGDIPAGNHDESDLEEAVDAKEQLKSDLHDQIQRTSGKRARKIEEKTVVDEVSLDGDKEDEKEDEDGEKEYALFISRRSSPSADKIQI